MDYTQNFIPAERQVELLLKLKKLLSPGGRIGSIVEISNWTAIYVKEGSGVITNSFAPSLVEHFITRSGMTVLNRHGVTPWETVWEEDEYSGEPSPHREPVWTCCFFSMQEKE